MEAFAEETVHEACHRDTTTFGFVKKSGNESTRDNRLVAGSVCHQTYMPRDKGLLHDAGEIGSNGSSLYPYLHVAMDRFRIATINPIQ